MNWVCAAVGRFMNVYFYIYTLLQPLLTLLEVGTLRETIDMEIDMYSAECEIINDAQ
jgi:hypothetical protein